MRKVGILFIVICTALVVASYRSMYARFAVASLVASGQFPHDPLCSRWQGVKATYSTATEPPRAADYIAKFQILAAPGDGYELFDTDSGPFWIPEGNRYDLAINAMEVSRKSGIEPGDVVLDCGAHLGTYTRAALLAGASRIVAIEPSPDNLECLRRTFSADIADELVTLAPVGVWSTHGEMTLTLAPFGSAGHTMVRHLDRSHESIVVPVTTIDSLVAELGLDRVDVIKMDIEGAEPHALRGAAEAIKRYRPRLYISGYHTPTDAAKIQEIVSSFGLDYSVRCDSCRLLDGHILPETIEFLP